VFSCPEIEQKQLNTWVNFQSAEQPLLGQFSVSGNNLTAASQVVAPMRLRLLKLPQHRTAPAARSCVRSCMRLAGNLQYSPALLFVV
jgi:hypothetical protein